MFAGKTRAYLRVAPFRMLHPRVGPWPYPQTLDWAGKTLPGTNTLAYYENSQITTVKSFIEFVLGVGNLSFYKH
jgi:hypothetical protein